MPVLTNARQERFCQLVKQGIPPYRAYPMAGYRPDNSAPYRLSENVRVKRRLTEITRQMAQKTRVTVESLTEELNSAIALAAKVEQPGAATQAIVAKAKLHGLMVDKAELGKPGDFAALNSIDEILAKVAAELGEQAAALIASAISPALPSPYQAEVEAEQSAVVSST